MDVGVKGVRGSDVTRAVSGGGGGRGGVKEVPRIE